MSVRRVGILGGGQLARMLALGGAPLGLECAFVDPTEDACAFAFGRAIRAPYDDPTALDELAAFADVVTFEFENVPASVVERLAARVPVAPGARALAVAQDRLVEKSTLRDLGVGTADYVAVDTAEDLQAAADQLGFPFVLKTRREGYDGKGQAVLREAADLLNHGLAFGKDALIAEAFVPFTRELSVIAVRSAAGEVRTYPVFENEHCDGILRLTYCRTNDPRQAEADAAAQRLLDALEYVGVLTLELFDTPDGLLANEFAPRVHNSGHATIEGAVTSQFENHMRAVAGLPLGSTAPVGVTAMINFIGELPELEPFLTTEDVHLHLYNKQPRPGRKIGHATVRRKDERDLQIALAHLLDRQG